MSSNILTIGQVAKHCGVAPRTATKWFDSGRLKGYRIPGSQDRRVPLEELMKFLRDNGMEGVLQSLQPQGEPDPLTIARNATNLLQRQGGEKYIALLAGMMKTCCTRCSLHETCELAYDPYNVNCEPKIDCLAAK